MALLSIVILNYNGLEYLKRFLPGVISYSNGHDVVVADNCSTDGSLEYLKREFSNVRTIVISKNKGYSEGYNEALRQIDSKYYVLLNSDVEVTQGWTAPILKLLENDNKVAAAQPKILDYKNRNKFEYAGAGGGLIDTLGYPFCRGRLFQSIEEDHGQYDDQYQIFWATGACLFIRSEVYHTLGGFDTDFFAHMEEIDLCWRINSAGLKVMYDGSSRVYHVGGGTLERTNPKKTYLNFRNGLSLLYKNYRMAELWWKLPLRISLDLVAALKFTLFDGYKNGLAVLKAHVDFIKEIPINFKKRRRVNLLRTKKSLGSIYRGSLVWDYFIKGVKTYSSLHFNSTK